MGRVDEVPWTPVTPVRAMCPLVCTHLITSSLCISSSRLFLKTDVDILVVSAPKCSSVSPFFFWHLFAFTKDVSRNMGKNEQTQESWKFPLDFQDIRTPWLSSENPEVMLML